MASKHHGHTTPLPNENAQAISAEPAAYYSTTASAAPWMPAGNDDQGQESTANTYELSAGAASHDTNNYTDDDSNVGDDGAAPMSQYAAAVLSAPQVVLFISASPESQQAFRLLEEARIRFAACIANDEDAPAATWGDAHIKGIAAIKDLANTIQKIDRSLARNFSRGLPPEFSAPDPRVAQWMAQLRERQLAEARKVLQDVLAQAHKK